ncbi:hypothetical protein LPJ59_000367 [Coemansia sp. RSA 2399]|nr:hypothetical protein LPJ59_000367 [Coemansia sp. RSA 2399]
MSTKRNKGYQFEWSRMLSLKGNTGADLQYTHAHLCSLARIYGGTLADAADYELLPELLAKNVVLLSLEPCTVVQYLFALCHAVSAAWEELKVTAGQPQPLANARMAMYQAARIVISNALLLLGIPPLETHIVQISL